MEMREFLGKVVTEVLNWQHVDGVYCWLEPNRGFEDHDKCNGGVQILLTNNRRFSKVFSWVHLDAISDPDLMVNDLRQQYDEECGERVDVEA